MEFDLKIYSYECRGGKIGKVDNIYENIEEAHNETGVSKSKIKKSITEGIIVSFHKPIKTTKEIVPGLTIVTDSSRIKLMFFFTGGICFEEMKNGYYKRIIKYENGNKIYDNDNIWQQIEEGGDMYISDTGYIKTVSGKINKGYDINGHLYARIKTEKGKIAIKKEDLVAKYFSDIKIKTKHTEKEEKAIRVVRLTKQHILYGIYDSYREAERETGVNRELITKICDTDHIEGDYLWYSETKHPQIIRRCFGED